VTSLASSTGGGGSEETPLPKDFTPSEFTVIIGRGKKIRESIGNSHLRVLARTYLTQYADAMKNRQAKTEIVNNILGIIRAVCPNGGAFARCEHGQWYEVSDRVAREKIGYVFRDLLADRYESSCKSKTAKRKRQQMLEQQQRQQQQLQQQQMQQASTLQYAARGIAPDGSNIVNNAMMFQQQQQQQAFNNANPIQLFSANMGSSASTGNAFANPLGSDEFGDDDNFAEPSAPSFAAQVAAARGFSQQQQLQPQLQTQNNARQFQQQQQQQQQQQSQGFTGLMFQQQQQQQLQSFQHNYSGSMPGVSGFRNTSMFVGADALDPLDPFSGGPRSPRRGSDFSDFSEASSATGLDDSCNSYGTDASYSYNGPPQVPAILSAYMMANQYNNNNSMPQLTGMQQMNANNNNNANQAEQLELDFSDLLTSPLIDCRIEDNNESNLNG